MTETKYPSHTLDKFQLRLPEGMREKIKEAAKESGRSMNAEIVHRLEESFTKSPEPDVLLSAEEALKAAIQSRKEVAVNVRSYVLEEIHDSIISGKEEALLDFERYFNIDDYDQVIYKEVVQPVIDELQEAGYLVHDFDGANCSVYFRKAKTDSE
jgi:hypothetical protein